MKRLLTLLDEYLLKIGVMITLAFVPLYPKLPSIHIIRTWVYIRLEDFLILAVVLLFFLQLFRKKIKLGWPVGAPIVFYWLVGGVSLAYSLLFIGPHLINFFPHLAILEYGRRIEYMILFFVAFATIRNFRDVKHYAIAFVIILCGIIVYGFGQNYYINLWSAFPAFFEKYSFCFPSFQTGNEEFAKGLPLCLPSGARITSTFGGHYDLAAYLVVVLPILLGIFFVVKKWFWKLSTGILFVLSLMLLLFTASRVSFFAYLFGAIASLVMMGRKKWIIPVVTLSIVFLFIFSSSTAQRLLETFRMVNVITNSQGEIIGVATTKIPEKLQSKIAKQDTITNATNTTVVEAPPPTENLPTGSSFVTIPQVQAPVVTTKAIVTTQLPTSEAKRLKLLYGGLQISTVSGTFLVQKALVYDISFTTRFQAEWPSAWAAFMSNPPLGKGYSTITLASDNDYLRLLGETGFLGFLAFALVFTVFAIYLKYSLKASDDMFTHFFAFGVAGGLLGLCFNAIMIDVFEASKVAESLWLLLGIAAGGLALGKKIEIPYLNSLRAIVTSRAVLIISFLIGILTAFGGGLTNFLVADDFTWLKWAAASGTRDFGKFFTDAQGFFYRPIDKILMYFLYAFFSFQPQGYRIFAIGIHFVITILVFLLGLRAFKSKLWAWILAFVFLLLPIHAETLFWMSTISNSLAGLFMMLAIFSFVKNREKRSISWYIVSIFSTFCALFSYEGAIVLPLLLLATDFIFLRSKITKKSILWHLPYVLLAIIYLFVRSRAHVVSIGGDYAYNFVHFIPNVIGNFFGYAFAAFTGERTVATFSQLRTVFKLQSVPVYVIGVLGVGIIWYFARKVRTKTLILSDEWHIVTYGLLFAFIALLPFLGLGAMSERYGYAAAFGFAIAAIALFRNIIGKQHITFWYKCMLFVGAGVIVLFFLSSIDRERLQWQKSGLITLETIGFFREERPSLPKDSTIYVVNLPTRIGNAWIFPTGLTDALWFVYKDPTIRIVSVKTAEDAIKQKTDNPSVAPAIDYIVSYDKNYDISEVKPQ